jgi:hypothetical protein
LREIQGWVQVLENVNHQILSSNAEDKNNVLSTFLAGSDLTFAITAVSFRGASVHGFASTNPSSALKIASNVVVAVNQPQKNMVCLL